MRFPWNSKRKPQPQPATAAAVISGVNPDEVAHFFPWWIAEGDRYELAICGYRRPPEPLNPDDPRHDAAPRCLRCCQVLAEIARWN